MLSDVMLYHEPSIRHARGLQIEAAKGLQGFSTGLGFWGSPGWVIGGALMLGLLEEAKTNSLINKSLQQLQEIERLMQSIRDGGEFVPINDIENIRHPAPNLWRANTKRKVNDKIIIDVSLVHNGDPFVHAKTTDGVTLFLAWDKIEQYSILSLVNLVENNAPKY